MKFLESVISVIILRAVLYIEELGTQNSLERFPRVRRIVSSLDGADISSLASDEAEPNMRYARVLDLISDGRDDVEQSVLDLCLAVMHVPEFAAYLKHHLGSMVTLKLAYDLESEGFPDYSDIMGKVERLSRVFYIDKRSQPIWHVDIYGDDRLFAYITGDDTTDVRLADCCRIFDPDAKLQDMFVRQQEAESIAEAIDAGSLIIQVSGKEGRTFVTQHALADYGCAGLFFDYSAVEDISEENLEHIKMMVGREALLRNSVVVISGLSAAGLRERGDKPENVWRRFVKYLVGMGIPVLLLTDEDTDYSLTQSESVTRIKLEPCKPAERQAVWEGFSALYGSETDPAYMAGKYKLSPGEVENAFRVLAASGKPLTDEAEFARICFDISTEGMQGELGSVIMPDTRLCELKADKTTLDAINQVCANSRYRLKVYDSWGMGRVFKYGRTISVLLAGPPGTGKTMTAHIIAGELRLPLYQVNISSIIDKYIGETEKHLEKIFNFAEKTDTVLFFDEADSLFGKRSEVNDASDRFANAGISYILQRIEQYDGIVVLATNLISNIDAAFMRRIKHMIKYSLPDAGLRREIWSQCLVPELECSDDIDVDFLAEEFEFSGGQIKNVVQNSCFSAAAEKRPLSMTDLLKGVRGELIKENRTVIKSLWGRYTYLMDE